MEGEMGRGRSYCVWEKPVGESEIGRWITGG